MEEENKERVKFPRESVVLLGYFFDNLVFSKRQIQEIEPPVKEETLFMVQFSYTYKTST
jgi:hypothetical protein